MTYDEITPTMRAFIGTHEVLRRLGFRKDDIFLMTAQSAQHGGRMSAFAALRTQGKEFNIELGPIESEQACAAEYSRIAAIQTSIPEEDLQRMLTECEAFNRSVSLLLAIERKGIEVPKTARN